MTICRGKNRWMNFFTIKAKYLQVSVFTVNCDLLEFIICAVIYQDNKELIPRLDEKFNLLSEFCGGTYCTQ